MPATQLKAGRIKSLGSTKYTSLATDEINNTISSNAVTIALAAGNHQKLELSNATGPVTVTLTLLSSGISTGTLLVVPDDTDRALTWTVTGGAVVWVGDAFSTSKTGINAQLVSWRISGTTVYLAHSGDGTSSSASENPINGTATAVLSESLNALIWNVCTGTSTNYTVSLPPAAGNTNKYCALRMSAALTKLVTIDANGTELIDDEPSRVMHDKETAVLFCDGTTWTKVAGKSLPMVAKLRCSASQSIANNALTKINCDSAVYDNSGLMANTASSRIDILRTSFYQIFGAARFENLSGIATTIEAQIYIDGASISSQSIHTAPAGSYPSVGTGSGVPLSAGTFIDIRCYQASGSSQNLYVAEPHNFIEVQEVTTW